MVTCFILAFNLPFPFILLAQSPTASVTQEQMNTAQSVFAEFQKAKQPFELCRTILERPSSSPYVKFQAASCLKSGIIRDWSYLQLEDRKVQLLKYLLEYVLSKSTLEPFVREQLLMVSAILLKRIGIEEPPPMAFEFSSRNCRRLPPVVIGIIESTLSMQKSSAASLDATVHQMFIATSFLQAILLEYSSSTRASDFGLPWIKHLDAKKRFEDLYLKDVFESTLAAISYILRENSALTDLLIQSRERNVAELLVKLLQLLETIFMWKFEVITIISSQYATHIDSIEIPIFQPPPEWRNILLDENLAHFIFFLYTTVRQLNHELLIHLSLQCLSQFSTLTGCVLNDPNMSLKFCTNLTTGMINLITFNQSTSYNMSPYEVAPLTQVFYRICLHIQDRDTLKRIEKPVMCQALQLFTNFTCEVFVASAKAESDKFLTDDLDKYKQAVENLCDGWAIILQAASKLYSVASSSKSSFGVSPAILIQSSRNSSLQVLSNKYYGNNDSNGTQDGFDPAELLDLPLLKNCTNEIYKNYIRCHLTSPDGYREFREDSAEIEEYEEDDLVAYNDQLHSIGSIGRVDLASSVSLLSQLMALRTNHLQVLMEKIATNGKQSVSEAEWSAVNEDIHWLIMVTTWTLTESNWFSERELIPDEVMKLSIEFSANVSLTSQVLTRLVSSTKGIEPVSTPEEAQQIDPVVLLIMLVFKLSKLEAYIIENNLQLFSPQVSSTISTFISRFMASYLMPNEPDYTDLSMCMISVFGQDTQTSMAILDFLIDHILTKMFAWSTESSVKESSAQTLVAFVYNASERAKYLVRSSQINRLLTLAANNQLSVLSVVSRKCIYQLLVLLASQKPAMFDDIFNPLTLKYQQIRSTFTCANDMNDQKSVALVEWIECVIGVTNGTSSVNITYVWTNFVSHIYLTELPLLFNLCHNFSLVIESLLEFMNSVSNRLLCYLTRNESLKYYETTIGVLCIYADNNKTRITSEAAADEESYRDILLIFQILHNLTSKDFIDWFGPSALGVEGGDSREEDGQEVPSVSASQVIFVALGRIMPLLSPALLEFPKLSQAYYKLMGFLCDEMDKLLETEPGLVEPILATVRYALESK